MGVVYQAHDRTLDETVAIKVLRQPPFDDPSVTQRFIAEIKLARRVTHKNVCRVHDYGEAAQCGSSPCNSSTGSNSDSCPFERRLSVAEGFDIALQLVDGLEAIHRSGHRTPRPEDVQCHARSSGTALLMDFGIAKSWQGETGTPLTASGEIIGTPHT